MPALVTFSRELMGLRAQTRSTGSSHGKDSTFVDTDAGLQP